MAKPNDIIGPYTLIRKLGRGGFGVVWLAEKRTAITTTKVALKLANDEDVDLEAIKEEASVWVHASGHPNVLPIIDADIYDQQIVIVSEYAPDGSLSRWLKHYGGKAPSIEVAVEMILGILAGLEHLHARGIIHRDLKPDNILLQGSTPRLADFGIARILKTTSKSTIATGGTPEYMPPEAFDGKRSKQTDIWSVGVIFYQLLTGRLPFQQTDIPSLLMAIVTKEPEPLPEAFPAPLREVIRKTLSKDPRHRYLSASEMRGALKQTVELINQPEGEHPTLPFPKRERPEEPNFISPTPQHEPTSPTTIPQVPAPFVSPNVAEPSPPQPKRYSAPLVQPKRKVRPLRWVIGSIASLLIVSIILAIIAGLIIFGGDETRKANQLIDEGNQLVEEGNQLGKEAQAKFKEISDNIEGFPDNREKLWEPAQEMQDITVKASAKFYDAAQKFNEARKLNVDDKFKEYLSFKSQEMNKHAEQIEALKLIPQAVINPAIKNAAALNSKLQSVNDNIEKKGKEWKDLEAKANKVREDNKDKFKKE